MKCLLCNREIPVGHLSRHHLLPEYKRYKRKMRERNLKNNTIDLHLICHRKIHSLFTNKKLTLEYNCIDIIKSHKDIKKFIKWIRTKPNDFIDTFKESNKRKS